jgi:hypothetical protein
MFICVTYFSKVSLSWRANSEAATLQLIANCSSIVDDDERRTHCIIDSIELMLSGHIINAFCSKRLAKNLI